VRRFKIPRLDCDSLLILKLRCTITKLYFLKDLTLDLSLLSCSDMIFLTKPMTDGIHCSSVSREFTDAKKTKTMIIVFGSILSARMTEKVCSNVQFSVDTNLSNWWSDLSNWLCVVEWFGGLGRGRAGGRAGRRLEREAGVLKGRAGG
jgi:hypothetical protein